MKYLFKGSVDDFRMNRNENFMMYERIAIFENNSMKRKERYRALKIATNVESNVRIEVHKATENISLHTGVKMQGKR